MDRLAVMAEEHYRKRLPAAYAAIPAAQRTKFFSDLAEEANRQIQELEDAIAGTDVPGETFQQRLGRLNEARSAAEQQVIRELILPEPTPTQSGLAEELHQEPPEEDEPEARELDEAIRAFWDARAETDEEETAPTP